MGGVGRSPFIKGKNELAWGLPVRAEEKGTSEGRTGFESTTRGIEERD